MLSPLSSCERLGHYIAFNFKVAADDLPLLLANFRITFFLEDYTSKECLYYTKKCELTMPDDAGSCFASTWCASCCAGGGTSADDTNRRRLAEDDPRRRDYETSRNVTVQPVVMSQIRPPQPQMRTNA